MMQGSVFSARFARDAPYHVAVGGSKGKMTVWNLENNAGIRKAFPSASKAKKDFKGKEVLQMDSDGEVEDEFEDVEEEDEEDVEDMEDV